MPRASRSSGARRATSRPLSRGLPGLASPGAGLEERLGAIESQLGKLATEISNLTGVPSAPPREQERFKVDEVVAPKPKAKPGKPRG